MKRILRAFFLSIAVSLLLATAALAAYSADLIVTETSGTAYTMLAITEDGVDNDYMATNGFMDADGLDTRVETEGGIEYPHMVADDRTNFAIAVPANSQTNLLYTTGSTSLTSFYVIPGYDGYFTVADAAGLELGDEFEIEIDGYFDTTVNDDIVYKNAAIDIDCDGAGNITASITGGVNVTAAVASGEHTIIVEIIER